MFSQKQIREGEKFTKANASLRLAAEKSVGFDDVKYKAIPFDKIVLEDGLEVDLLEHGIKIKEKGYYEVSFGVDAGFNGQEELALIALVNGIAYSNLPAAIQGRSNNKPVVAFWKSVVFLNENDLVQLGGKNYDSGAFTCHLRRLHFEIKRIK